MLEKYLLDIEDGPFHLMEHFLSEQEADRLFEHLQKNTPWRKDTIKIFGKIYDVPRLQALYGDSDMNYTYSGISMDPLPWTNVLTDLKLKIESQSSFKFNVVLINYYRDGQDSNGWHSDDEPELGKYPKIASISLGESRVFQLRHKITKKRNDIRLDNGSLLLMSGDAQSSWKHQIPKSTKVKGPRINLTFRRIFS